MRRKKSKLSAIRSGYGRQFVVHWEIGLVLFFLIPLISSLVYSFSNVIITPGNVDTEFVGFTHYAEILKEDAHYLDNIGKSLGKLLYTLPITVSLSLILAIVLNQRFTGRLVARAVFFLPVIIASGPVLTVMRSEQAAAPIFNTGTQVQTVTYGQMINFDQLIEQLQLPTQLAEFFQSALGNLFFLVWGCGVQIILFIAGMQTIPAQLYEASKVEGANKWEEFWYVTVPMLGQIILLVIVYTLIEFFLSTDNVVIAQAYKTLNDLQVYDKSSAMIWFYFLVIGALMGLIIGIYNRVLLRKWEGS